MALYLFLGCHLYSKITDESRMYKFKRYLTLKIKHAQCIKLTSLLG